MDYKNTLNLPRTDFPMRADLVNREPERLAKWQAAGLNEKSLQKNAGAEKYILHDGPPFANGDVHIGTALNKTLKDIIIKFQSLRGKHAPYVPGWDCHGLPIEFKVTQELRKEGKTDADAATIRTACETYARKYIDLQREQFKRLGVFGDWDHPYLTLNKEYEAEELRLFADIVEKGFVYRGKKPVYWSIPARTALAEAEVEYKDHVSPSIYVKFPLVGSSDTFVLIWTTTPWTLPANLAVAYNSSLKYSLVQVGEEKYLVCDSLLGKIAETAKWDSHQVLRSVPSEELAALEYQHPFCNRTGKLFAGDNFVEDSTGTGFVHIAPGHGLEDYGVGRANNLPIYSPVDDNGCLTYTNDLPIEQQMPESLVGKSILEKNHKSEANEAVLEILRENNTLLHKEDYPHSYPHCWRSKTPVIFRAMDQWFINVDHDEFRKSALKEIDGVKWIPDWGINRIRGAVETRPDWCISRQRTWGVPIPAFYDAEGNAILDAAIVRKTADLIEQHGSNVWFEQSAEETWAAVKPEGWTGADAVSKSHDTLDVWIDSGSSSRAVLKRRDILKHTGKNGDDEWQADIYLEGSDQHRGWFQSSLLLSLAGNGAAPYKTVLTHGFMVDKDREKIAKSKQETPPEFVEAGTNHSSYFLVGQGSLNPFKEYLEVRKVSFRKPEEIIEVSGIKYFGLYLSREPSKAEANKLLAGFQAKPKSGYEKPQTSEAYIKEYGADIVRLWIASQDFRNDIVVSADRIKKVGESYRGIRNALRFQLSNLFDFDPAKDAVADDQLTLLDRWVFGQFARIENEVLEAYERFEFHQVYQRLSQFAAVELSSIYHDLTKDRLYSDAANSPRRRSTQTTLHRLVRRYCQLLSPILVFTADETWEYMPGNGGDDSVHLSLLGEDSFCPTEEEEIAGKRLFELRDEVLLALETARKEKVIGKSLEAVVTLKTEGSDLELLNSHLADFQEMLNVSVLKVDPGATQPPSIQPASELGHQKCNRCWHWESDVNSNPDFPDICGRCADVVKQHVATA